MEDLSRAGRTQKVCLSAAAEEASIAHHLEHLRPPIDDDGELLAREGSVWQGGYVIDANFWCVLDGGARLAGSAFTEDARDMSKYVAQCCRRECSRDLV